MMLIRMNLTKVIRDQSLLRDFSLDASMRPRQACLGIRFDHLYGLAPTIGFNEAEASLPRNTSIRDGAFFSSGTASMRPRQACLGIPVLLHGDQIHDVLASMRPRQACLGIQGRI